jgi:hypothetical protein
MQFLSGTFGRGVRLFLYHTNIRISSTFWWYHFRGQCESCATNASNDFPNYAVIRLPLLSVLSIAWGGVMAFDITVFVLTLYKAIRVGRNVPLIHRLLRDGKRHTLIK